MTAQYLHHHVVFQSLATVV